MTSKASQWATTERRKPCDMPQRSANGYKPGRRGTGERSAKPPLTRSRHGVKQGV